MTPWIFQQASESAGFIESLASGVIVASFIALIAWIGSRLVQRPALWHLVWLVALLKLFLPPIWLIPTGLLAPEAPQPVPESQWSTETIGTSIVEDDRANETQTDALVALRNSTGTLASPNTGSPALSWPATGMLIWMVGSMIMFLHSARAIAKFHRIVRRGGEPDAETVALTSAMTYRLGKRLMPRIRIVDSVVPPLLWPLGLTSTLVLPSSWWKDTSRTERQTVLMHELVHWRRGDHRVRLLQLVACVVFWWHPLVWIARRELHRLEEQCCDAEVMHRLPDQGRAYASALLSVSEWLNRGAVDGRSLGHPSSLAMPMSHSDRFQSFHRRISMLPELSYRPWSRASLVGMALTSIAALAIGLSAQAQSPDRDETAIAEKYSSKSSRLVGQIVDTDGRPIEGATIRVVTPKARLIFPIDKSEHQEFYTETDASGKYSLDIDGIGEQTTASIDVLHRGHRRLVGTLMSGGDPNEVTLVPGKTKTFDAKLPETAYFAGVVVDDSGKPVPGVAVNSNLRLGKSHAGVERTVTDNAGRFAVYGYDLRWLTGDPVGEISASSSISFEHSRYEDARLGKLEDLDVAKRESLRVVVSSGFSIAGTVFGPEGTAAGDSLISIVNDDSHQRKAVRTDARGRFRFDGVAGGKAKVRVVDVKGNRKRITELAVDADQLDMKVTLEPIESPITSTVDVLGMTLSNVTPTFRKAYEFYQDKGVMIVDPGLRSESFKIGDLEPGFVFWMVGKEKVDDLASMLQQLIKEATEPTVPLSSGQNPSAIIKDGVAMVRVVYSLETEDIVGTNTQYMRLTKADVEELRKVRSSLP